MASYGARHTRIRRLTVRAAYGTGCRRCGGVLLPGTPIELDHNEAGGVSRLQPPVLQSSCRRFEEGCPGPEKVKEMTQRVTYRAANLPVIGVDIALDLSQTSVAIATREGMGRVRIRLD